MPHPKSKPEPELRPDVITQPASAFYLKRGFDQMADLLAITLGPTQGVIINDSITKKGPEMLSHAATVARRVVAIPDRKEDVGAMLLRRLVWETHQLIGDGGATTAVLAQAILHEARRMVTAGANTVLVQRGIKRAVSVASEALRQMATPVTSQDDLTALAQAVTGISPYLITAQTTQQAIQQDCRVALFAGTVDKPEELRSLLDLMMRQSKPRRKSMDQRRRPPHLLLAANKIGGDAISLLVGAHNHPKSKLKVVAVDLEAGGSEGHRELNDLALLTGATLLGDELGRPLRTITAADLGQAKRVEASKTDLFVIKGGGDSRAIREEITSMQAHLNALPADDEDRPELQKRIARLSGSAGILKIGAHTKPARDVLRQKAEQGIKVLAAALEEGYLPGGGIAYVQAAASIDLEDATDPDERLGMVAVKRALKAPFFRILQNAAVPAAALILQDVINAGPGHVYDVLRKEICLGHDAGILDATKIIRLALEKAASGAEMALSVDVTVLRRKPRTTVNFEP
jgi:chaperonin GroEL